MGKDNMRVTGCGESELYERRCENRGAASPPVESHQPLTESEARMSPPRSSSNDPGCAWARQQTQPPPPAGSVPPPWLSAP